MGFFKKILSNYSKEIINASKDIVNESKSMLVETTSLLTGEKKTQAVREAINEPDVISSSFSEKAVMRCPNCGIETDSKFCPECGTKIVKEAGAGATAAPACPPIPTMTESPKAPIKPIKKVVFVVSNESIEEHTSNGVLRIPDGVTTIKHEDYSYFSDRVNEIIFPSTLRIIGDDAFFNFEGLSSVTIPNSVTSIGNSAFRECSGLTNVTIGNSVTSIGDCAFGDCSGLTSVTIGNSVTSIGEGAFSGCSGLTSVTIPNSVTSIGNRAFDDCSGLTSVTIGNSVTSIGDCAFGYCSFDKLVIPDSVVSIGEMAFSSNNNLRVATIGKSAKNYFNQSRPIFDSCGELTELTVRSEVAEYTGAKSLTKITICDTVKELGKWAFNLCPNLEEVVVPDSVTKIGYGAFAKDENLKTIELSDNITEIGEGAFYGTRLKEIVFPKELSKIGRLGGDMYKLRKLDFSKVSKLRVIPEDFLGDCPKVKELVIPMGVTAIEETIGGENLNNLFLPPTIEEIEEQHQVDLNIYCFAPEIDELESLTGYEDKNNIFHPNHLFVLPQYLDAYRGQQVAEGISQDLLTIDVIPEEFRYYYE